MSSYYERNKERLKQKAKEYYEANKVEIYKKQKEKPITEKRKKYRKNYDKDRSEYFKVLNKTEARKEYLRSYQKNYVAKRKNNDPVFKLRKNITSRISQSIKNGGYTKRSKTYEILGCSYDEFKTHIESHWEPWMNWDNYGLYNGELNYGWDLDHIIPTSSAIDESNLMKLHHYSNIRPLCSYYNRHIKVDRVN